MKKYLIILSFLFSFLGFSQTEFITIWEPGIVSTPALTVNAPYQANANQIWFPGIGQNYTIQWEEIGNPQNNGTMTNVTSTSQVLIDFGNRPEAIGSGIRYKVKVSNGNGVFQQMKFATHQQFSTNDIVLVPHLQMFGSADKLIEISQWGNIAWTSMNCAFTNCQRMQITATDTPNLSNVTNASLMFYRANNLLSPISLQHWDTSHIQNFSFMFAMHYSGIEYFYPTSESFNPPNLNNWNVSSATDLSYMFMDRVSFNQNLSSWDVSSVKNMSSMFAFTPFNYPLNNWNTQNLESIFNMFSNGSFNQPLNNWNTSKVTNMINAFAVNSFFNQPLDSWDVSNVAKMQGIFGQATSFNQSLANWNLVSLTSALGAFNGTALSCENYSKTLAGWANNPNTANNVVFLQNSPMQYASNVVDKRNILLNKNWTIGGDSMGSCLLSLSVLDNLKQNAIKIYPNPATNNIYIKNVKHLEKYEILDYSGRLITSGKIIDEKISVKDLTAGNYLLNLYFNGKVESYKFIKK